MRPLISSQMTLLEKFGNHVDSTRGYFTHDGFNFVSGGLVGNSGDIVVDSVINPVEVIGIADGNGKIIPSNALGDKDIEKIQKANHMLRNNWKNGGSVSRS